MSDQICAVVRQPDRATFAAPLSQLSSSRSEMPTRSLTARLEQRRTELGKLQTTSQEFKQARNVIPRSTGRDKLWFQSGQYWGKDYTIGLILKYEGLPIQPDDPCFQPPCGSKRKIAWDGMQSASAEPPVEEQPRKRAAVE